MNNCQTSAKRCPNLAKLETWKREVEADVAAQAAAVEQLARLEERREEEELAASPPVPE